MKRAALFLLACALVANASAQPIIFIVRHAEKADNTSKDPDLSAVGRSHAEALAHLLKDAGIVRIYVTAFKRTQQTAAPLSKLLSLETTTIAAGDSGNVIAELRKQSGNVLVVGHSNTIPELIKALGIDTDVAIGENDYDDLFAVLTGESPRLLRLHYHN